MKTHLLNLSLCASLMAATPALAQHITKCDPETRADTIVEPWEANTGTFGYVDAVRLALLDTVRPQNAKYQVMILTPPRNEYRQRYCFTISHTAEQGFVKADYSALIAEFDQSVGLLFRMPVEVLQDGEKTAMRLVFAVNEATASIQAVLQDASTPYEGDQYSTAATASSQDETGEDDAGTSPEALAEPETQTE